MTMPARVAADPNLEPAVKAAADAYVAAAQALKDKSYWPVKMFAATNLFLEHLDILDGKDDPVPLFRLMFGRAEKFLKTAASSGVCGDRFPGSTGSGPTEDKFEEYVSGLFSDIWVGLSDDVYFDESYSFTKERFEKSGVDPVSFFKDKTVLDAGCGSGKFSAAIARFGAAKVIGLDLGEKGLEFARSQAKKVPYGNRLDYRHGSLLDIPLADASVDIVWSNGVIHHTLGYERCIEEFARILKPGGSLFLYVNGRFGLFELLQESVRHANEGIPRTFFLHYLNLLGINTGRIYFMMDCFYAPYEWKSGKDVKALLTKHGFEDILQLTRGVALDSIEQITTGAPFATVKYGEGQLKYIARKPQR